jgi:hypothetical protein
MADQDIASQWKSFSPERREGLLAKMTPEQKKKLRSTLEAGAAPPTPAPEQSTPGYFKRLGQGLGLPTSKEEVKAMEPSTAEKIIGPTYTGAKIAYSYGKNLYQEGKNAVRETGEAASNVMAGQPVGQNLGKVGAAGTEFLLKGILSPVGGGSVWAFGEDISKGNHTGAAGDATAVLVNALLLKGATKPDAVAIGSKDVRANKIAFASNLPNSMDAPAQVKAVLPDLDRASRSTPPKTVGDLLQTVNQAKKDMNTESGLAMQPLKGKQYVPTQIADAIKRRITPDMDMTPGGRQAKSALLESAKDFEKPWTYEQLDQYRMNQNPEVAGVLTMNPADRAAYLRANPDVAAKMEAVNAIKDIVYPAMDKAAGKPAGYFANLKGRQSTLIEMEKALNTQVNSLATRTAKIKGSPRFSTENVSAYGHPASAPGLSIHKLQNAIVRPNPLGQANAATARAFSGRPAPTAAIMSLPVRELLLLPQQEAQPPQNRKEALTALGR